MNLSLAAVVLAPLVVLALGAVAVTSRGRAVHPVTAAATLEAARSHASLSAALAWLSAAVTAMVLVLLTPSLIPVTRGVPGLVPALVPTLAGLVALGVQAVGEVTWPRPTGAVRVAGLTPRSVAQVAPPRLRVAFGGLVVLGVVALVVLGLVAAPDGRSVERTWAEGERADGLVGSGAGPFPGFPYGVPVMLGWVVLAVGTEWVLRLIARRPAVAGTPEAADRELRTIGARRVLRGSLLLVALHVAAMLAVAAFALAHVGYSGAAIAVVALAVAVPVGAAFVAVDRTRAGSSAPTGHRA